MDELKTVEIPFSKRKLYWPLFSAAGLMGLGIWNINQALKSYASNSVLPVLLMVSGILCIIFFGVGFIIMLKRLKFKGPGLVLDKSGITDNSAITSVGFIPWSEISEIRSSSVMLQRSIALVLKNPTKYIEIKHGGFHRLILKMNNRSSGTPIIISEKTLDFNFPELLEMLRSYHKAFRTQVLNAVHEP